MTTHRASGFSLVELMAVLVIFSIMLAIGVPTYTTITGSQSLQGTTGNIAAQLKLAREKAIATGSQQTMHFTLDYLDSDYHIHNGAYPDPKWNLPKRITYYWGSGTNSAYVFRTDGTCTASGMVILQDTRGRRDTVIVQQSGMILVD